MTDSFNDYFSKHASEYARSKSHRNGEDLKSMVNAVKPGRDWVVLDMATGTGFTAMEIAPFVREVIALDATQNMLDNARIIAEKRGIRNISFINGRVEETGLESGRFDLVTCRRAAHHFPDKRAFLMESGRVLRNGGILALVDMVRPMNDRNDVRNSMERIRDPSHVDAPSTARWADMLEETGFSEISTISTKEHIPFEEFLSPVKLDSREGKNCLVYLRSVDRNDLQSADIDPDDFSIIKERVIFIYRKVPADE